MSKTVLESCALSSDTLQRKNFDNLNESAVMKGYTSVESFDKLLKSSSASIVRPCPCHSSLPYSSSIKNTCTQPINSSIAAAKEIEGRNGLQKSKSRAQILVQKHKAEENCRKIDGKLSPISPIGEDDILVLREENYSGAPASNADVQQHSDSCMRPNDLSLIFNDLSSFQYLSESPSEISILANGLSERVNNLSKVPNGISLNPIGLSKLQNGLSLLSDGLSKHPNGISKVPINLTNLPNDYIKSPNNPSKSLNGLIKSPNGISKLPNGHAKLSNGIFKLPNGFSKLPNGFSKLPNGFYKVPNGLSGNSTDLSRVSPTDYCPLDVPTSTATTTCLSIDSITNASNGALSSTLTGTEGAWVRPLGYAEKFMTYASSLGNMTTVYSLWLDSKGPIQFRDIKKVSSLVYRKMRHLRLCVRERHGISWWKEMDSERIDIEEICTDNVIETFEELLKKKYNVSEGPLWFMRFLTFPNQDDDEKSYPDSNHDRRYKYVSIFGFHHNVSDGTTNMNFCDLFISVLNDVLQGKDVDVCEVGRFAIPIHDALADAVSTPAYQIQLYIKRVYKGIIAYCEYVKNFIDFFPLPRHISGGTRIIYDGFDEHTTQCLLKRCKMEKVTLNSAFTAAANVGMYKMIQSRDPSIGDTIFDNQQAVNMRRYWPADKRKDAFGCHISMLDVQIPATRDDVEHFWEYSRKIHKILWHELNVTKKTLLMQPMSEKLWLAVYINSWLSRLKFSSANDSHYCITNMGNVSATFTGEGPEVNVSRILRSVNCHFMPTLCQHSVQTFRGKFYYSLDYYSQKLTIDTARLYADSLLGTLKKAIFSPN